MWCKFCTTRRRCDIYAERPTVCREFVCDWARTDGVPEHLSPLRTRVVMVSEASDVVTMYVDPGRPDAYKAKSVNATIRMICEAGGAVIVIIGDEKRRLFANENHRLFLDLVETVRSYPDGRAFRYKPTD